MAKISRRKFLQSGTLAGVASVCSTRANGEVPIQEIQAREIGMSKWDLESPALCVDLDKMDRNLVAVHNHLKGSTVGVRPHTKTHKCPAIAKMQVAAGAVGVCTAKLSETEVMLENGIEDVLMTGANLSVYKIKKAMALRKQYPGFIQAVDNPQNAQDLQDAAKAEEIVADVVVDVMTSVRRSGVVPGAPALALAQMVDKFPNLNLRGMLAYDGSVVHIKDYETRRTETLRKIEPALETFNMLKAAGLNMEIFSGAGTGNYEIVTAVPGFTDVQVGSYVFMDCQYIAIDGPNGQPFDDFEPSLTVITTILNSTYPGLLVSDAGAKSLTINKPTATVIGEPQFSYNSNADEYGKISFDFANRSYKAGDKLEVIVPHCDPVVNLYDFMYGIRGEKVESILPILGRGKLT